jgi:hypothetical protein
MKKILIILALMAISYVGQAQSALTYSIIRSVDSLVLKAKNQANRMVFPVTRGAGQGALLRQSANGYMYWGTPDSLGGIQVKDSICIQYCNGCTADSGLVYRDGCLIFDTIDGLSCDDPITNSGDTIFYCGDTLIFKQTQYWTLNGNKLYPNSDVWNVNIGPVSIYAASKLNVASTTGQGALIVTTAPGATATYMSSTQGIGLNTYSRDGNMMTTLTPGKTSLTINSSGDTNNIGTMIYSTGIGMYINNSNTGTANLTQPSLLVQRLLTGTGLVRRAVLEVNDLTNNSGGHTGNLIDAKYGYPPNNKLKFAVTKEGYIIASAPPLAGTADSALVVDWADGRKLKMQKVEGGGGAAGNPPIYDSLPHGPITVDAQGNTFQITNSQDILYQVAAGGTESVMSLNELGSFLGTESTYDAGNRGYIQIDSNGITMAGKTLDISGMESLVGFPSGSGNPPIYDSLPNGDIAINAQQHLFMINNANFTALNSQSITGDTVAQLAIAVQNSDIISVLSATKTAEGKTSLIRTTPEEVHMYSQTLTNSSSINLDSTNITITTDTLDLTNCGTILGLSGGSGNPPIYDSLPNGSISIDANKNGLEILNTGYFWVQTKSVTNDSLASIYTNADYTQGISATMEVEDGNSRNSKVELTDLSTFIKTTSGSYESSITIDSAHVIITTDTLDLTNCGTILGLAGSDPVTPTTDGLMTTPYLNMMLSDSAKWSKINRCGMALIEETTIAFDETTKIFTLGSIGDTWQYMRAGRLITVTGSKAIDLDTVTGFTNGVTMHIFIDNYTGVLSATVADWNLTDSKVPVSQVTWNSTLYPKYWLSDERHTYGIDKRSHLMWHSAIGNRVTGAVASRAIASGSTNQDNCFGISAGNLQDDDLFQTVDSLARPTGATGSGGYVVWYHTGAGTWAWDTTDVPMKFTAGGYVNWDNGTGVTQGANGDFINSYVLVTNSKGQARHSIVMGRAAFASTTLAYAENIGTFDFTGIGLDEVTGVYQLTWQLATARTQKGKARLSRLPQRISTSITTTTQNVNTIYVSAPIQGAGTLASPLAIDTTTTAGVATQYDLTQVSGVKLDSLAFKRNGGRAMLRTATDSVGIRTALPQFPLDVNGVVHATAYTQGSADSTSRLVFDGDSYTAGDGQSAPYSSLVATTHYFTKYNVGVSSKSIPSHIETGARLVDSKYCRQGKFNIVILYGGVNIYGDVNVSVQDKFNWTVAYCRERRKAGFKVIVTTLQSIAGSNANGTYDAQRTAVNALIRANWQSFADELADFAADTRIGDNGDYSNTTYFQVDQVHLNDAGAAIVAGIASAAVNRITNEYLQYAKKLQLPLTNDSTNGVIRQGAYSVMHSYRGPNAIFATGENLFIGKNAGNFTSDATNNTTLSYEGGINVGIGFNSLNALTTGFENVGMGWGSLAKLTSGDYNTAFGAECMSAGTITGDLNLGFGQAALKNLTSGVSNVGLGPSALTAITTQSFNIGVGYYAGAYETGSNKIIIDNIARGTEAAGRSNALFYGVTNATAGSQTLQVGGGGAVVIDGSLNYAADAQSNDTYVITLATAPIAYKAGMVIYFKANTANTGACTINVNSLGAKAIKKAVSTDPANNDILAGMMVHLVYDGTNFIILNPRTL